MAKFSSEDTGIQDISRVKDMANSKFFWLPLLGTVLLCVLFSNAFYGVSNIVVDNDFLSVVFDLNVLKIFAGTVLLFLPFRLLQGKGCRIGGYFFLVGAFLCPVRESLLVILGDIGFDFPVKMLYSLLFLTCWYCLSFYACRGELTLTKTGRTFLLMTVFAGGICEIMAFVAGMKEKSVSFLKVLRDNNFNPHFVAGIVLMLFGLTFLWKDIIVCNDSSGIYGSILYSILFVLPIAISSFSIGTYISFNRRFRLTSDSLFTMETAILCGCLWLLILFYQMYQYRMKRYGEGHLLQLSESVLKKIAQIPLWFFLAALLFSDIFYGGRGIAISTDGAEDILSWELTLDFNMFKVVTGIVLVFILIKLLQGRSRKVAGWICFGIAVICPVAGTIPVVYSGVRIDMPVKIPYMLLFLTCWFVLVFYTGMKEIPVKKVIKVFAGVFLFAAGIFELVILYEGMSNQNLSFVDIVGNNKFSLLFILGIVFILSAVTILWRDVSDGEGLVWICSDIISWSLFIISATVSFCSLWGYVSLVAKTSLRPLSKLTLSGTGFVFRLWILLLFYAMYNYRVNQCADKKDSYFFMQKYVPQKIVTLIVKVPLWLFWGSVPMVVIYFFRLFPWLKG